MASDNNASSAGIGPGTMSRPCLLTDRIGVPTWLCIAGLNGKP